MCVFIFACIVIVSLLTQALKVNKMLVVLDFRGICVCVCVHICMHKRMHLCLCMSTSIGTGFKSEQNAGRFGSPEVYITHIFAYIYKALCV